MSGLSSLPSCIVLVTGQGVAREPDDRIHVTPDHPGLNARIARHDLRRLIVGQCQRGDTGQDVRLGRREHCDRPVGAKRNHASLVFQLDGVGAFDASVGPHHSRATLNGLPEAASCWICSSVTGVFIGAMMWQPRFNPS